MARGTVKWFDEQKGYGFITPLENGAKDVFVFRKNIAELEQTLEKGAIVEYEIGNGPKGPEAKNVRLAQSE